MNRISRLAALLAGVVALIASLSSCEEGKSYAELLNDENKAVNRFLADQRVVDHIPADSIFEVGEDAPYYCLDTENSIYMQVLDYGDGEKAVEGQKVYFRYRRYPIDVYFGEIQEGAWSGNANNITSTPTWFKYDDYTDQETYQWGTGIQQPLHFLNLNCHVRLVVKSQYGNVSDLSSVVPYLYEIRYFKSQI